MSLFLHNQKPAQLGLRKWSGLSPMTLTSKRPRRLENNHNCQNQTRKKEGGQYFLFRSSGFSLLLVTLQWGDSVSFLAAAPSIQRRPTPPPVVIQAPTTFSRLSFALQPIAQAFPGQTQNFKIQIIPLGHKPALQTSNQLSRPQISPLVLKSSRLRPEISLLRTSGYSPL